MAKFLNIPSILKSLKQDVYYVTVGGIIGVIFISAFWLVWANIMGEKDYGFLGFTISFAYLAANLTLIGFPITITTFIPKGENGNLVGTANLLVFLTGISVVIALLFTNLFFIGGIILGEIAFQMVLAEFLGKKDYKKFMILIIICRAGQFVLALIFYFIWGMMGIFAGFTLALLFSSSRFFRYFFPPTFNLQIIKEKIN